MPLEKKGVGREKLSVAELEGRVKYLELQVREVEARLRLREAQKNLKADHD
jgi:hypothetical protein